MSEQIELADTICTTEDAFESFQANVAYEEEEYITLSDLASPSDNTDAKLPEVTLESICDENGPCGSDLPNINETAIENSNEKIDDNVEQCLNNDSSEHNILIENNGEISDSVNNSIETSNKTTTINQIPAQNEIVPKTPTRGRPIKPKRGRPRREAVKNIKDVNCTTSVTGRRGRRNITETNTNRAISSNSIENMENVQIVSSTINDSLLNGTLRKRGRNKKVSNELIEQESMTNVHLGIDESTKNTSKGKLKGVSKKKKKNDTESEKIDSEATIQSVEDTVNSGDNIADSKKDLTECKLQNDAIDSSSLLVEMKNDNYLDDETDDICLSQLKSTCELKPDNDTNMNIEIKVHENEERDLILGENESKITKRIPKKPALEDFEYNIDTIVTDVSKPAMDTDNIEVNVDVKQNETENNETELEALDTSKRPVRRRTKQVFKYDEESDEDPFANVELSDDEPRRRKKGKYTYSDDEYVPGMKYDSPESSLDSDMEIKEFDDDKRQKKGRVKKFDRIDKSKSPKKRGNRNVSSLGNKSKTDIASEMSNNSKTESEILDVDIDIEDSLKSSVLFKDTSNNWESTSNISDYLAKKIQGTDIKIIKSKPSASPVTKFEIPVINQNEPKKTKESDTQTTSIVNISKTTQTDSQQVLPMKKQVNLSSDQSEKACEFLKNIVETTAELGELMTQKSRDFIEKKINTINVTDTLKMDYCVKKSFLLFKLAKHNLMQMENELETKYEEFLRTNNLLQYREQQKTITPKTKDDSDCEIVEEITPTKPEIKPKFNPKTVFLNKELSIKIAKTPKSSPKPAATDKHNMKGRHTVWLNESVMVKKVQPTQSFLAQDSRNKKPPDFVTLDMVKNFFDNYYRHEKILSICRPYTSMEWLSINQNYVCNYFVKDASDHENEVNDDMFTLNASNVDTTSSDFVVKIKASTSNESITPKRLLTICTESIQKHLHILKQNVQSKIVCDEGENSIVNPHIDMCHESLYKQNDKNGNIIYRRTDTPEKTVKSLKAICILKINTLLRKEHLETQSVLTSTNKILHKSEYKELFLHKKDIFQVRSLSLLCFKVLQRYFLPVVKEIPLYSVTSLSSLAIKTINAKLTQKSLNDCEYNETQKNVQGAYPLDSMALTINCVSSITKEEDYSNFQTPQFDSAHSIHDYNEDDDSFDNEEDTHFNNEDNLPFGNEDDTNNQDFNPDADFIQQPGTEDSNWVSMVQMQELRSCLIPSIVTSDKDSPETDNQIVSSEECSFAQIKIEPEEPEPDINVMNVKAEPQEEEEMQLPVAHVVTKEEHIEEITQALDEPTPQLSRQSSKTYSEDLFESFVSTNKIIKDISTTYMLNNDEIYSQSSQRIRRQYEPDSDGEKDTFDDDMGLLVPQSIEVAKDQLMENSSDEDSNKKQVKKKPTKTLKSKKNSKEVVKDKFPVVGNDVAVLTRRMKEKIRQLEKKNDSSDSETENIPLQARRAKPQVSEKSKDTEEKVQEIIKIPVQCSEVDSTEHISSETSNQSSIANTRNSKKLKKPQVSQNQAKEQLSPDVDLNVPSELLECEPDIAVKDEPIKNVTNKDSIETNTEKDLSKHCDKIDETEYIDRYGWKCYCINPSDPKIYENASVVLEKLPESFVDTYLRFQDIEDGSDDDNNDAEVNRLTNLASLARPSTKDKTRVKHNDKNTNKAPKLGVDNGSSPKDINKDDQCAELTPSEDEDDGRDYDDIPQEAPRDPENSMAKNLLMNDNESDSEQTEKFDENIKIKQEPGTEEASPLKVKSGPKSKTKDVKPTSGDSVMLTADIMMNSELKLLNTPVVMKEEPSPETKCTETKDLLKPIKMTTRGAKKQKLRHKTELSKEDESSSEEEKQWVFTKEKLLKRIEKKHDTAIDDEAKGAKRVSEFIEKRGEASEHQSSKSRSSRGKRSKMKALERRKQMNILARELFGEQLSSRKCSQNYSKGRRNIRKVLNKQNLNHSTIIANKEEFDRKRRLNNRQAQLREHLGCEEGVNVVVINDELCLEYDFENNLPVAGVHKFFTQVMKAHQYEGVKFMWDACFESVSRVASGDPGGGCILAHCMGLGKTLQVLALLHTVLTHPMLNMKRVLVCCPLSTVLNWVDEIHKWIDPVTDKIKTFELSKLKRTYERAYQLEDWYNNGGIFIIGYELFRSLTTLDSEIDQVRPTYIKKIRTALLDPGPDIIVCDEGHLLKNDCSVLAVAMSRVSTKRRIVLTGTPMQNNLREYYCMVNFVKPSLLGTYAEYSNRFENPIMNGQHRDSREDDIILMKTRTHILHKVLEGCLQRQEASVLYPYLPKKYEYTVFIPLTQCQKDLYTHYLNGSATKKGKQLVLKDFHILQKIWTHPLVLHNFQTRARDAENKKIKAEKIEDDLAQEDIAASEDVKPTPSDVWWLPYLEGGNMLHALESSNKFHVVFQLLDECVALGDKVLIFSTSLYTMDALEHFLRNINNWSLGQEYYRLDGSVPADVRQKWCREFNAENNVKTKLFLVSTRAGCLGLNMTAANRVIILDTSWNPAHDIQSIFRVYRFGQKKDCFIYRLVAMGTMEQKIYERSVTKQAVACRVVDEQQIDRHFNSADLTELYSWDEEGWGVAEGVAAGVRDAALLRVAARGALHAVREHDSLLRGSEPALPEHERAAAWQQFQLEHVHPANPSAMTTKKEKSALEDKASTSSDFASTSTTSSKVKKGKNNQTTKEKASLPTEEGTDKEEMLVKKIMQILIENNFHETIQAEELTNLIVNVRRLVSSRMGDNGLLKDPIAAGIASVLLQDDAESGYTVPDEQIVEDTAPIPVEDTAPIPVKEPQLLERRKRSKKMIVNVESDSSEHTDDAENIYDDNDVEWNSDIGTKTTKALEKKSKMSDMSTKPIKSYEKKSKVKKEQEEKVQNNKFENVKRMQFRNVKNHDVKEDVQVATSKSFRQSDSILISDEDDDEPISKPPPLVAITKNQKIKEKAIEKQNVPDKREEKKVEEERVPLHPFILSNDNFIKIVAHMYQRGNSMLSDDAAKMAAQYSTNKARSEYEATGVPIVSGPLYEIAVESLGLDQLKRMHESIKTQFDKPPQPSITITTKNNDDVHVVEAVVEKKAKKKTFVGPKSRKRLVEPSPSPPPIVEINEAIVPEPIPQNVFPVGMFKGPVEVAKPQPPQVVEECILPDDDEEDVVISSVVHTPARILTPPANNETASRALSRKNSFFIDNTLPSQTLLTDTIPKQITPNLPTQSKAPHKQIKPVTTKQTKTPPKQITQNVATPSKPPHIQITPNLATQSAPTSVRVLTIDKGTPINPQSTPAANIPSQVTAGNEPICLSDSDDEIVPHPVGINNPSRSLEPVTVNQPPPIKPTKGAPIIVQSVSFKGGTPFVLSDKVKKMLDPNKKYYCIPASSLMTKDGSNPVSDSSLSLDGQNRVNNTSKPSIVITSRGQIRVNGVPQSQSNSEVPPHVVISPSTPTKDSGSHDQYTKKDISKKSGKIEVTATQVYSANDLKSLPTKTATNKILANAQNQTMSQPSTSNIYSRNSSQPNMVPQAIHRKRSPSPPTDHMQLFKDVVQIQAESYKELPNVQITKTKAKPNVIKILKDDLPKPKSVANTSRDRPVMISKPLSTIQRKGSPANNKLVILKKIENTKHDNIFKPSSSPKVINVERAAAKKLTASSFIDLTDIPERTPKVEKRPAPYVDKSAKKQKKLLTLADFSLDDIDDITELE
ncbi:uncharacterized protein LOC123699410 [Colias croceus]|uniref:uncharacterized protein LOC123699410 n=1 Tax=Colias crocea TaxID=72248 RepID=UPI001E27F9B5|nr:uncharacterized protein LOC123699410 [Colias croceus]